MKVKLGPLRHLQVPHEHHAVGFTERCRVPRSGAITIRAQHELVVLGRPIDGRHGTVRNARNVAQRRCKARGQQLFALCLGITRGLGCGVVVGIVVCIVDEWVCEHYMYDMHRREREVWKQY